MGGDTLPHSPLVVRAAERRAYADAGMIRAAAEADAAALRDAERRRGYEQGFRTGLEQGALLAADAAQAVEAFWAERETELHDLSLAIAHRVLASFSADEVTVRLVREAIAEHRRDVQLTLRVPAGDAPALREALHAVDPDGRVLVVPDPSARPGTCTLIHPRGRTRIGLLDQFRALMQSPS